MLVSYFHPQAEQKVLVHSLLYVHPSFSADDQILTFLPAWHCKWLFIIQEDGQWTQQLIVPHVDRKEVRINKGSHAWLVRLQPGACSVVPSCKGKLSADQKELINQVAKSPTPPESIDYLHLLIDTILPEEIPSNWLRCKNALQAVEKVRGDIRVGELADALQITSRHLGRIFRECTGLSTKQFLRIWRFRKVVQSLCSAPQQKLTYLSFYFGYYDQSHFTNEFTELCGRNPRSFIAQLDAMKSKSLLMTDIQ
jgi:AraC-like DNA-binding protein